MKVTRIAALFLSLIVLSCTGGDLSGKMDEFRSLLADSDTDLETELLSQDEIFENSRRLVKSYPGAAYILASGLRERALHSKAIELYEAEIQYGTGYFANAALRELLELELERRQYRSILEITSVHKRGDLADPRTSAWLYSHRFEALLRTNNVSQAFLELQTTISEYPGLFESELLPHGLLYYRAIIGALYVSEELDGGRISKNEAEEILVQSLYPYGITSSARSGHAEIVKILDANDELMSLPVAGELVLLLGAKSQLLDGNAGSAIDDLQRAIGILPGNFSDLQSKRIHEGLFRDVYNAAMRTGRYTQGGEIFDALESQITPSETLEELIQWIDEYRGRLLLAQRNFTGAAVFFESVFHSLDRQLNDVLDSKPLWEEVSSLAQRRELMLWRWIGALQSMDDVPFSELGRAYAWVHSRDFFRDVSDEFIGRLFRGQRWDELYLFLKSNGNSIPAHPLVVAYTGVGELWLRRQVPLPSSELAGYLEFEKSLTPLNLMLMQIQGADSSAGQIESLYSRGRRVPASAYGLEYSESDNSRSTHKHEVFQTYAHWGRYTHAADYLISQPINFQPDPGEVVKAVEQAYSEGRWYEGMYLLETDVSRRLNYSGGLEGLAAAAGGSDGLLRLLYPQAYSEIVDDAAGNEAFEPELLYALMREESRFRPSVYSPVGAVGLGQIMPETGADLARRMRLDDYDLLRPVDNIEMSAFYLAYLKGRFSTLPEVLAAYNAGQGRVDGWLRDFVRSGRDLPSYMFMLYVPFEETRNYLYKVLESKAVYEYLYGNRGLLQSELRTGIQLLR